MPLDSRSFPSWDSDNNRLWFQVDHRGRTIQCCVDALCLYFAYGAPTLSEIDATNSYTSRLNSIHASALSKAHRGALKSATDGEEQSADLSAHDTYLEC